MEVGTPLIMSAEMSGLKFVKLFFVELQPPVEQPPLVPQEPKK